MHRTIILLAVLVVLVGPAASAPFRLGPSPVPAPTPVPMRTIGEGPVSGFLYGDEAFCGAEMVIRDLRAWRAFWAAHTANLDPRPPLPAVDFRKEMVLVVLLGPCSTGGPGIHIRDVVSNPEANSLVVNVVESHRPGMLPVITNPFHIVAIPKAPGSIAFIHHEPPVVEPTL